MVLLANSDLARISNDSCAIQVWISAEQGVEGKGH